MLLLHKRKLWFLKVLMTNVHNHNHKLQPYTHIPNHNYLFIPNMHLVIGLKKKLFVQCIPQIYLPNSNYCTEFQRICVENGFSCNEFPPWNSWLLSSSFSVASNVRVKLIAISVQWTCSFQLYIILKIHIACREKKNKVEDKVTVCFV